jgi:hypothetical protein
MSRTLWPYLIDAPHFSAGCTIRLIATHTCFDFADGEGIDVTPQFFVKVAFELIPAEEILPESTQPADHRFPF